MVDEKDSNVQDALPTDQPTDLSTDQPPDQPAQEDAQQAPSVDPPVADAPAEIEQKPKKPAKPAFDGRPDEVADVIDEDEPVRQEGMDWFVLRVASNKEHSVRNTLLRKVQIDDKLGWIGRILVPTEKIKTFKNGKQKISESKLYPGYVFVEMRLEEDGRIQQDVFFLIKETTGVGDFVGTAGRPTPLKDHEVEKMLRDSRKPDDEPTLRLTFAKGEEVTINDGPFEGYEGSIDEVMPEKSEVRVLVTIFGRQAPIDVKEWQITKAGEG